LIFSTKKKKKIEPKIPFSCHYMTQFRKERVGIREEEMGGNDALWKKYGFRCRWLSPICIHSFMVLSRKGTLPCFLCSKEIVFVIFNFCFTALH
jgi:hypothetical protein